MMKAGKQGFFRILGLMLVLTFSWNAQALDLDSAKAQGLVGEQSDGYVGAVKGSADVKAMVAEINAKRAEAYARIAGKNGIPVDKVAELAAKKLIDKASPDEYIKIPSGAWVLKKEIK